MRPRIKVVVVDDSPTMRALIVAALQTDPDIVVAAQAGNAQEARQAIKAHDPDVVTLDVEMPEMSGIELLEKIMRLRPTPVVMISTLTHAGAQTTLRALELGAIDCLGKPMAGGRAAAAEAFGDLATRVRAAASARVRPLIERPATGASAAYVPDGRIVAIGSSTGGVEALITLLSTFPANCPPTVITQHMPPSFTRSFAARLDRICAPSVAEAEHGALLRTGSIHLAPGGENHLRVTGPKDAKGDLRCSLFAGATVNGHRPSVDVLFHSLAQLCPARIVGVLLTGMGRDGAEGLLALRQGGAHTIGQDEQSCVVYGMPKVAREIGAVERSLSLERIAAAVLDPALRGRSGHNVARRV